MRCVIGLITLSLVVFLSGCASSPATKPVDKQAMSESHFSMGRAFLEQSNASMALTEFIKAQELDPQNADIPATMAQAYEMKRAFALAEEHYQKAIAMDAENPYYHHNLGALYLRMERFDDAIPEFQKAADNLFFPQTEMALAGIGYAYQQQKNCDEAATYYRRALDHRATFALGWLRLGECTFALGDTDKAIVHYKKAIGLAPTFPMAHFRLGLAYLERQQREDAKAAFETTIEQAPESEAAGQARHYLKLLN